MASLTVDSRLYARTSLFLVGLVWTLPFLQPYHNYPLTSFYSEWLAFALGLAAATLLVRWPHAIGLTVPTVIIAPLGLVAVYLIQAALGRVLYPEQILTAALYLIWATLMIILGATLRRELDFREIATTLSCSLVIGGVISALAGVSQHYSDGTLFGHWIASKNSDAVYGNVGQRNNFADYVALALAAMAYLFARGKVGVALSGGIATLLLFALALSGSRSSWLYLVSLVVLSSVYCRRRDPGDREGKRLLGFVISLVAGFLVMQWITMVSATHALGGPAADSPSGRLFGSAWEFAVRGTPATDPGIATRLHIWEAAWSIFLGSPLMGAGLGQFAWHQFEFMAKTGHVESIRLAGEFIDHSHNIVMQLLAESGVVGVMVVLGPVLAWIASLRRQNFEIEHWWLLSLLAVIGVHSLLEYPLWYSYFLGIFALLLGMGATEYLQVGLRSSASIVAALVLAFGWFHAITILHSYRNFERLVLRSTQAGHVIRGPELKEAVAPLLREPVLKPYVEVMMASWMAISPVNLRDKLQVNSRATRIVPIGRLIYRQAFLLALNGQSEEALQLFDQAVRVFPDYLAEARADLAQLDRDYPGRLSALSARAAGGITDSHGTRKIDK